MRIQIGVAVADYVQMFGKQFGIDVVADALVDFAIEGKTVERGLGMLAAGVLCGNTVFEDMVYIYTFPCPIQNIEG